MKFYLVVPQKSVTSFTDVIQELREDFKVTKAGTRSVKMIDTGEMVETYYYICQGGLFKFVKFLLENRPKIVRNKNVSEHLILIVA